MKIKYISYVILFLLNNIIIMIQLCISDEKKKGIDKSFTFGKLYNVADIDLNVDYMNYMNYIYRYCGIIPAKLWGLLGR